MGWASFIVACNLFLWHLSEWDPKRESCISADTNRLLRRLRAVWDWLEESRFYLLCYSSRAVCLTIWDCKASVAVFISVSCSSFQGGVFKIFLPSSSTQGECIKKTRSQDSCSMGNSDLIEGKRLWVWVCLFVCLAFFLYHEGGQILDQVQKEVVGSSFLDILRI